MPLSLFTFGVFGAAFGDFGAFGAFGAGALRAARAAASSATSLATCRTARSRALCSRLLTIWAAVKRAIVVYLVFLRAGSSARFFSDATTR